MNIKYTSFYFFKFKLVRHKKPRLGLIIKIFSKLLVNKNTMEKITKNLQFILLSIILISTVIAVAIEIKAMFLNQSVTLADLLLMFLYLEVIAMVRVFWDQQSISITLPLLIAITALSRFIILQGKEMDPSGLVYEAVAIVLIASAIVILRLRHSDKLGLKSKKK